MTLGQMAPAVFSMAIDGTVEQRAAERAAQWLLNSGVQINGDDTRSSGGFAAWYDEEARSMPYVYAEITGYLATYMCWQFARTSSQAYVASAIRAADWLLDSPIYHAATGAMRCLYPLAPSRFEHKRNQIYVFDCGVILNGLINVYRASGDGKYLDASVRLADWLCSAAQRASGAFRPVFEINENRWIESNDEWSLCSGSYHTKVCLGLANLYDVTRLAHYKRAAERGCDFALRFQQKDGRFVSFPSNGGTNSHPHTYSAEGLWAVGHLLGREDYLLAARHGVEWLYSMQSADGLVPRHFHDGQPLYNERVDILAQALRMAEILMAEGALHERYAEMTDRLAPLILRNQAQSAERAVDGGFYFGRLSNGEQMRHVNVWVSAFASQALVARDDRAYLRGSLSPRFMV